MHWRIYGCVHLWSNNIFWNSWRSSPAPEIVLSRLSEYELYVDPDQCTFFRRKLSFLGRWRIKREFLRDTIVKKLLNLGQSTQLWQIFVNLSDCTKFFENRGSSHRFYTKRIRYGEMEPTMKWIIRKFKISIDESIYTCCTRLEKRNQKSHDAFHIAFGRTLTKKDSDRHDKTVSYFSRCLSPTEENYSANDTEGLALVYFQKRSRCYLEGSSFEIITDYQLLEHFLNKPHLFVRKQSGLISSVILEYPK